MQFTRKLNIDYVHFAFSAELNGFTYDHIRRLPNSPTQNGTDSILSFYALLPSGSGLLPSSVLATIFTSHQDKILSGVDSELQEPGVSIASTETPALTPTQTQNIVLIIIFNFRSGKVSGRMSKAITNLAIAEPLTFLF